MILSPEPDMPATEVSYSHPTSLAVLRIRNDLFRIRVPLPRAQNSDLDPDLIQVM